MPSSGLSDVLTLVAALPQDEQQTLFDYLADALAPANQPRQPLQLAGSLGVALSSSEGDPIADALDDLRRERAARWEA